MNNYEINRETLLILPIGKNESMVYELDGKFVVKMSPLSIIKNSCLFFGSSFDGRKDGIKNILGIDMKIPILIEESRNIIFFPTNNCINHNAIWVSFKNIIKYEKFNEFSTVLYFHNHNKIKIDVKFNLIDNQYIRCIKLESLLNKRRDFIKKEYIAIEENM